MEILDPSNQQFNPQRRIQTQIRKHHDLTELMMKWSGGILDTPEKASYLLLVIFILIIGLSFFIYFRSQPKVIETTQDHEKKELNEAINNKLGK